MRARARKRCIKCRKVGTIREISSDPVQINPRTLRGYTGLQCAVCGSWNQRQFTFTDVEEEKEKKTK